jgi:hypothetical protein
MSSAAWLDRFDAACERWTDRLNPVLVKETRQALRSRSFLVAFLITLGASWCLSLALVGMKGESLQLGESGPEFFRAYLFALLLPLCFVVPLGVFRSATAEFADQTFEVLATSTLTPSQIAFGKLQSAAVSMAAYLSAMAPYLCFTYLLRGLSLPAIVLGLLVVGLASLIVTLGALAVGAAVKHTWWQPLGMLIVVSWGMIVCLVAGSLAIEVSRSRVGLHIGDVCAGLACLGYFLTVYGIVTVAVAITQFTPPRLPPGLRDPWLPRRGADRRPVSRPPRTT